METKEVLNYLFSNPSDKLTSQFQITERGRTIGLAFIAKLMRDGKEEIDVKKVAKFIKKFPCAFTSKTTLKDFGYQFERVIGHDSSFAKALFTSDYSYRCNYILPNLSQFTKIGRHFGYAFLALLMNHNKKAFKVKHVMDFITKSKYHIQLKETVSEIHDFLCQFGIDGLIVPKDPGSGKPCNFCNLLINQNELDILRDSGQAKRDIIGALHHYPRRLKPKMKTFTFDDGRPKDLLCLEGTIPVPYRGSMYNIPVGIWVLDTHPAHAPMVYVRPTADMQINVSRNVDKKGKIYLPYLQEWDGNNSDILSLIQMCIITFGKKPPVIRRQTENKLGILKEACAENVKDECTICFGPRHQTYLLFPCGHATFCKDCALRLSGNEEKRCPDCRTTIQGTCRVFGTITGSK